MSSLPLCAMSVLGEICRHWDARYGIQWSLCGSLLKPQVCHGDCHYLDESQICRFASGEGLVGRCFTQKRRIILPNVEHPCGDFVRRAIALADGIHSVLFIFKNNCVLELGFGFCVSEELARRIEALPEAYYERGVGIKTSPLVASAPYWHLLATWCEPKVPAFTPVAHRSAFLDRSGPGSGLDQRCEEQMPDSKPPLHRVIFDIQEVRRHSCVGDAWIVVHNNVYNITNFIKHHPGWTVGSQSATITSIMRNLGKDCTVEFDAIHPKYALRQLADYRIGEVTTKT